MSEKYFSDLYDWLQEAYESAMRLAKPELALQYAAHMRTMEQAGLVPDETSPTIH